MTGKIEGIIAAVPTPFTADGKNIDIPSVAKQVDRLVEAGVHGIVTTGTTGEFPALTIEEHKAVIKANIDAAKGKIPVIAGIGCNSTKLAIEMVQFAEKSGAAAVMVVPPFYDPLSFKALYKFYEDVCSSISVPLMYYNLPGATGVHLTADEMRQLAKIKNFDYIKDTSGNAKELANILTNPSDDFLAFNGWDTLSFFALTHGARGNVFGVASIVPKECVELWNTIVVDKNLDKAREQWKFIWEICNYLEEVSYPAGVKAGLDLLGLSVGPVRAPLLPLEQKDIDRFADILSKRKFK